MCKGYADYLTGQCRSLELVSKIPNLDWVTLVCRTFKTHLYYVVLKVNLEGDL